MTGKRVEYHEGAVADAKGAVSWYLERSPKAGADFIEELRRATETIATAPERWAIGPHNTRRFLLWKFPFTVILERETAVVILAVAHASRQPEYWKTRVR